MYEKEGVAIIKSLYKKKIEHEFAGVKDFWLCGEGWWKFYISVKIIVCELQVLSSSFESHYISTILGQILVDEKNVNKSACNKLFLCKKVTMRLNKLIKTFT